MEPTHRIAVVTGASSGLGEVFARKLAAQGYDLLLVARRLERLEQLQLELERAHGVGVEPYCADLADDAQTEDLARRLEAEPRLALLVNNAGFGSKGLFHETDYAAQLRMHKVHVLATLRLTRAALPGFVERREGAIINVASVASFFRSAGSASYCATKGWMRQFTETLKLELDSIDSPVTVQALCPGFTYTEFHDVLGGDRSAIAKPLWMKADFVVEQSLAALAERKLVVVPGWRYQLAVAVGTKLPTAWRLALEARSPTVKLRAK